MAEVSMNCPVSPLKVIVFRLGLSIALATLSRAVEGSPADPITSPKSTEPSAAVENQTPVYTPEENASYDRGAIIFNQLCHVCHGKDGKGAPIPDDPLGRRMAPPLSGSPRVNGRPEYIISALLCGLAGPVDDQSYTGLMVAMRSYDDQWIADVASYVRTDLENSATMITTNQVAAVRRRIGDRADPFSVPELLLTMPVAITTQDRWIATASRNPEAASNAIAGAARKTGWSTEAPQASGMSFRLELPEPVPLCEIDLEAGGDGAGAAAAFPRKFKVELSLDGKQWTNVVPDGQGKGPNTVIAFDPCPAKALRIVLVATPPESPPWSISQIQLYQPGQGVPVASRVAKPNSFE
jgi:mono/diheme cytochrome c family protein